MATPGLQIAMPNGDPAAWGTSTSDRNFQRFTGTTSALSSALTGGRWYTLKNDGTVAVNIEFTSAAAASATATAANIAVNVGETLNWVTVAGMTDMVAAFAAASGADVKLWCSEASA